MRGLFKILLFLFMFAGFTGQANAYADCASNTKGDLLALGSGAKTFWNLFKFRNRENMDVYILLATSNFGLSPAAKVTVSSSAIAVLNCAALEGADAEAAALRARLAKMMKVPVGKLTAAHVQTYYRKRLKHGPVEFSEAERHLWADILGKTAKLEPMIADSFATLAAKLNLPPPSKAM